MNSFNLSNIYRNSFARFAVVGIHKIVGQFFGISAGLLANYVGSYMYVFVKKYAKNNTE